MPSAFEITVTLLAAAFPSSKLGSTKIFPSISTVVTATGVSRIGSVFSPVKPYRSLGMRRFRREAMAPNAAASARLPLSSNTCISIKTIHTFSPSSIHNLSRSIVSDPRMPRSTTLASCMLFSFGGPDSNLGDARGTSSAFVIITPLSGVSGKGVPSSTFTPTKTSVSPIFTRAEPSARFITSRSTLISRYSRNPLPSSRFPFLTKSHT
nr:conserved hypothetical protein [uncultured archaeon GZfos26D8]